MELWDIVDENGNKTGRIHTKGEPMQDGEFHLAVSVWIKNSDNKYLISKRVATKVASANMWETTSGGAIAGDSALEGTLRELEEELGMKADVDKLRFIGSYARINDFVEVFLLESNIDVNELKLQEDEVQAAKWISICEFEEIIKSGNASDTSFNIFKNYYDNFYKRYLTFENGRPIFKRIGE